MSRGLVLKKDKKQNLLKLTDFVDNGDPEITFTYFGDNSWVLQEILSDIETTVSHKDRLRTLLNKDPYRIFPVVSLLDPAQYVEMNLDHIYFNNSKYRPHCSFLVILIPSETYKKKVINRPDDMKIVWLYTPKCDYSIFKKACANDQLYRRQQVWYQE
ncbi:MAG: hypothetical protein K0U41_06810 [Gammaproteobacteria bacterium]|nr:hypothetical protein [Gammaproteobacteria bacterium]